MELPKSLGTVSKDVYSTHYYGPDNPGTTLDVAENGYNVASVHPPVSFGFENKSSAPTWGALMEYSITPEIAVLNGNPGYIIRTSGNTKFVPEVDRGYDGSVTLSPVEDVFSLDPKQDRIGRWRETAEKSNVITTGKTPSFEEFVVSRYERQPDPAMRKFVTDVDYEGPLNDFGKNLSKAETLRQDWENYLQSVEGEDLKREKSGIDNVEYISVISIDGVIYGVGKFPDGKIFLATGTDAYSMLSRQADIMGVSLDDMRTAALGEEAMHIYRKSYNRKQGVEALITEEISTKQELLSFYRALADNSESKPELRAKYLKIVRHLEHDVSTVRERYSSFGKEIIDGNSDLEYVLMAEAYAKGLKTDEEVRDYVENKLEEMDDGDNEESSLETKVKNANLDTENDAEDSEEVDSDDADAEESNGEAEAA